MELDFLEALAILDNLEILEGVDCFGGREKKKGAVSTTPFVKIWRRHTFPQTSAVSSAM